MAHVPERTEDMSSYSEGQTHQLMNALEEVGFSSADITALGQFPDLIKIRGVVRRELVIKHKEYTVDFDVEPSVPAGWRVLPDNKQLKNRIRGKLEFDLAKVKLHLDSSQEKGLPEGNELRKKLEGVPVYGAQLGDFYMTFPYLIPDEWKGKAVLFWGTIYLDHGDRPCVRFLAWFGGRWHWRHRCLCDDFGNSSPAVISSSN